MRLFPAAFLLFVTNVFAVSHVGMPELREYVANCLIEARNSRKISAASSQSLKQLTNVGGRGSAADFFINTHPEAADDLIDEVAARYRGTDYREEILKMDHELLFDFLARAARYLELRYNRRTKVLEIIIAEGTLDEVEGARAELDEILRDHGAFVTKRDPNLEIEERRRERSLAAFQAEDIFTAFRVRPEEKKSLGMPYVSADRISPSLGMLFHGLDADEVDVKTAVAAYLKEAPKTRVARDPFFVSIKHALESPETPDHAKIGLLTSRQLAQVVASGPLGSNVLSHAEIETVVELFRKRLTRRAASLEDLQTVDRLLTRLRGLSLGPLSGAWRDWFIAEIQKKGTIRFSFETPWRAKNGKRALRRG